MKEKIKILQEATDKLLSLMATKAKATVEYDKENEAYIVGIDAGDETGLLIGKKGETLSSIQTVLGILFKQKTGEWNRVVVNVGDYIISRAWRLPPHKELEKQRNLKTYTT